MKLTIEVSDFWIEEGEIQAELKKHLIYECVAEIKKQLKAQIDSLINTAIKEEIDEVMLPTIKEHVATLISDGMVKPQYSSAPVPIKQAIEDMFTKSNAWGANANDELKKIATNFGNQMKQRYDLVFASQVVSKMQEQGFLKDDVAQKLLPQK